VADHGEMLGEHQLMGHGFGVFQDLIHVPLLIRLPGQTRGRCVVTPVSTTRLFHTLLDVGGLAVYETVYDQLMDVKGLSLAHASRGGGEPGAVVYSEAYAPEFALEVMEARKPALIEQLHCRATHWAAYEGRYKLISIEDVDDRLFSLDADPLESHGVDDGEDEGRRHRLVAHLKSFLERARARRPDFQVQRATNVDDVIVQQRLRDLGYVE
jgi:arylsulfatase A-like enzyme